MYCTHAFFPLGLGRVLARVCSDLQVIGAFQVRVQPPHTKVFSKVCDQTSISDL